MAATLTIIDLHMGFRYSAAEIQMPGALVIIYACGFDARDDTSCNKCYARPGMAIQEAVLLLKSEFLKL